MKSTPKSPYGYSLTELEGHTDFDKRTIAYYISCGLLPKVGRRGPKTTYPQEFFDRLMLIDRVKRLQYSGELRTVSLRELAAVMQSLSQKNVQTFREQDFPAAVIRNLFHEPDLTSPYKSTLENAHLQRPEPAPDERPALMSRTDSARVPPARQRRAAMLKRSARLSDFPSKGSDKFGAPFDEPCAPDTLLASDVETELTSLLTQVNDRARASEKTASSTAGERLLRVPITEDLMISVRNIELEDAGLVEKLAALLRRLTSKGKS